jgi:hypothetical protein
MPGKRRSVSGSIAYLSESVIGAWTTTPSEFEKISLYLFADRLNVRVILRRESDAERSPANAEVRENAKPVPLTECFRAYVLTAHRSELTVTATSARAPGIP